MGYVASETIRDVYLETVEETQTRVANLRKLGIPGWQAYQWGNSRLGCWRIVGSPVLPRSITNEKLVQAGYFEILKQYERMRKHLSG